MSTPNKTHNATKFIEIYAKFKAGSLKPIEELRSKYARGVIYPRDIGICLDRGITETPSARYAVSRCLAILASKMAPFEVSYGKAFRNKIPIPPAVYYEVRDPKIGRRWPGMSKTIHFYTKSLDRVSQRPCGYKVGLTGIIESDEADRILEELKAHEKPPGPEFDAFIMAVRPIAEGRVDLENDFVEFPFTASEDDVKAGVRHRIQRLTNRRENDLQENKDEPSNS